MYSRIDSCALVGIEPYGVQVEVDITGGLPGFDIVGLPDTAVRESRIRVKSAIRNSGFEFPNRRIHVNLSPADMRKEGPAFDLPLALAILNATEQLIPAMARNYSAVGELTLEGKVRPVPGVISIASGARDQGSDSIIVPRGNEMEAALIKGIDVFGVSTLRDAVSLLEGDLAQEAVRVPPEDRYRLEKGDAPDYREVRGQEAARRAIEVAVAGGHNILMVGPPGSGKTMLARRMPGIMPPLTLEEALEVTRIYSVAGLVPSGASLVRRRPFRSPHSSISAVGLVGGGAPLPRPGEVSLAHYGVLYMDELALFNRSVLDSLRGPLEDRCVNIVRSMVMVRYPARFSLAASMNPCPCGYLGDARHRCDCSPYAVFKYRSRISGPLLDRIDIHVDVPALLPDQMQGARKGEPSCDIRQRVSAARTVQEQRFEGRAFCCNAEMDQVALEEVCRLDAESRVFMSRAMDRLGLSARSFHRALKVARTVADLETSEGIEVRHLAEAVQYRFMDRKVL